MSTAILGALGMAVIFIYIVLASQFGSFVQPLAIMASLPLSLVGVMLALLFTGTTLNIFSMIGLVMLMGLVTKNAILLVDFANQGQRARLEPVHEALLAAGQIRLRPILMTTAAMIFGMLPLALGARRRRRAAGADGPRDHWRRDYLDAADAGRGAGHLYLSRFARPAPAPEGAWRGGARPAAGEPA